MKVPFTMESQPNQSKEVVSETKQTGFLSSRACWVLAVLIGILGFFVRIYPLATFQERGLDETFYRSYLLGIEQGGLLEYPQICESYIENQSNPKAITKLPPTRFLYVYCAWLWKQIEFGDEPSETIRSASVRLSLKRISVIFSIFFFLAGSILAWRMMGPGTGLGVMALMAFSPLQIHMGQQPMVDGFFAFWATMCLWMLWENLQRPNHPLLLFLYGLFMALMVLTKENAFFVFVGICGILLLNKRLDFGKVDGRLLLMTVLGPLVGVACLTMLAGGVQNLVEIYRLLVTKAQHLDFAIRTGDGPWYRYLIDLLVVSPLVLCLAIGGVFTSVKSSRPLMFMCVFVGCSYILMCNIRYGMNLRYTMIWELPLCMLAAAQVLKISTCVVRYRSVLSIFVFGFLALYSFRQYTIFFVGDNLHEVVMEDMLNSINVVKK